mmetsp:Transcript_1795/g.3274  ORF Transcript_1795/g.3274 Transcript_1795/m.3274 type:complete len:283 (-) Transcript_1795:23-871(-)
MVAAVMPPLASITSWGKRNFRREATSFSDSGSKLSSITISAPASAASAASSKLLHSTSILEEKPHARRALLIAAVILPLLHMWLSFSMTMCDKSMRCVLAPPTSTAYFSTSRKPGVTLRVAATSPCQLCERAMSTICLASVATPLARLSTLSAVRSPNSKRRAAPRTVATCTLGCGGVGMTWSPSFMCHSTVQPSSSKMASTKGTPANTPALFPSSQASSGLSPTTKPPTSKVGQSSASHCETQLRQEGGRMVAKDVVGKSEELMKPQCNCLLCQSTVENKT